MARVFLNRRQAGEELAKSLLQFKDRHPVVLGLVRGGMIVAEPIAQALSAPLEPLVARKVGSPNHPEFGMGAVADGGVRYANEATLEMLGISYENFAKYAEVEEREVQRRQEAFLQGAPPIALEGRCAILVDDGLATGVTAITAARRVRAQRPTYTVLAVPVASSQGIETLSHVVDEVVSLLQPPEFYAVGQWYEDFKQTTDEEVLEALQRSRFTME
jgi:predicted phosphoribosyltransferase